MMRTANPHSLRLPGSYMMRNITDHKHRLHRLANDLRAEYFSTGILNMVL